MEDMIKTLKQLGLTEYESKAYITLTSLVTAKADEISKEANIPRSKIYITMEGLEKKGFIIIQPGRPIEYTIKPPEEILSKLKIKFIDDINKLEKDLSRIYENKLPSVNTPILSIENKNKILQKQVDLLKRSKQVVLLRIGFILPEQKETFKKEIISLLKRNVDVKILASKECIIKNQKISIEKLFEDVPVEIKYVNLPTAQLIIRDNKEMFLVFANGTSKSVRDSNMIGLLNSYPTIITHFTLAFTKHWNS